VQCLPGLAAILKGVTATRPPGRPRVWTGEQQARAAALHAGGTPILGIAADLGLTYATTRRLLIRAGRIPATSARVENTHRDQLLRLARHLERGRTLQAAASAEGVTLDSARLLIREAATLLPETPTQAVQRQAAAVRRALTGTDVRAAAQQLSLDPWWALLLLVLTGSDPVSMLPQMAPETRARAELMAARRAAGAIFEQIGEEFGATRKRARRILLTTGGGLPRQIGPARG
jgi:predicted transcriptional regulator